jgi:hypothetical protein
MNNRRWGAPPSAAFGRSSFLWIAAAAFLSIAAVLTRSGLGIPVRAAESSSTLQVPPESPRWDLQGEAKVADYQGRKCLLLDGGAAILKDFEMRDGVIDFDVATTANRGFFGVDFRLAEDGATAERIYLRPHKSGLPDAIQYTPVLGTGANWQIYSGPGFTAPTDISRSEWFHMRVEVSGAQAKLYVKDMNAPALVMRDLKSGAKTGRVALYVLTGATYYSNFEVRTTPDATWIRHPPPMPPETLVKWSLSPTYDALARDLERAPSRSEIDAIKWEDVEAEPPGFVVLYRYREAPHLRVTFQSDWSTRLDPQPGMKVVYARTRIDSDRDQRKKLLIGYSDDVSVFLNGTILYRGRSAQGFRDPGFLGIVNPENDIVYLPLKKGANELMLAVSELGGGWGFICRLADAQSSARGGRVSAESQSSRISFSSSTSPGESSHAIAAFEFVRTCDAVVAPGITEATPGSEASQDSASSCSVCPWSAAKRAARSTIAKVASLK